MDNFLWSFDVHITTFWRANPILFTLGLCAVGFGTMNILSTLKTARARGKRARVLEEELNRIPQSHLTGIDALPVELWSQIIKRFIDPHLQHKKRQCYALPQILKLRLVCRLFDDEIKRALHQRLSLYHIPYYTFLASRAKKTEEANHTFRNALLSSALYRATTSSEATPNFIRNRIGNCVLVAQHISANHSFAPEQELYKTFCDAASTSHCCWNYIFSLRYQACAFVHGVDGHSVSSKESDLLLESALLVANGYSLREVKHWLIRLGRLGMLVDYRGKHMHSFTWTGTEEVGMMGTVDVCQLGTIDICTQGLNMSYEQFEAAEMEGRMKFELELDEEFAILE